MADARLTPSRQGIRPKIETFTHNNTIVYDASKDGFSEQAGLAVTMSGNGEVGLVGDAEPVFGKLVHVEDGGVCAVQTGGYVELPAGDGATVTAGQKIVGDLGAAAAEGYVRNVAVATLAEVAVAAHRITNAATATAVEVLLDG